MCGAVDRGRREAVDQDIARIERLHRRIAVVERVGPRSGRVEGVGAVGGGAGRHRLPAVAWIVDVGGGEIAGRGRVAKRAVIDPAGLEHRPGDVAADHRRVVGAVDGDGDSLRSAVDGRGGERVGQRVAGIERLHRGIAVVERVGPGATRCQRVVAKAAGGRRADRDPLVWRVVHLGRSQIAGRDRRPRRAVADSACLHDGPAGVAGDHRGVVGAVDGEGDELCGAVDRGRREAVDQDIARIERLHRRIAVVERVGPRSGRVEGVGAVGGGAGRHRLPAVAWIVDVGGGEIAGRGRVAKRAVIDPAGLEHRPGDVAADHRRVVGAVDGDGDSLRGAVDGRGGERVGQRCAGVERLHGGIVCHQVCKPTGPQHRS